MAASKTIIETDAMSLWFHPDDGIIHHQMHKYPGREVLERVLMRGLDVLSEEGACKWLSDDRKGGALPKSHHEWGDQVWGPQAAEAGWKYWALLPPQELLGQANMQRLSEAYAKLGVTVQVFDDVDRALAWLRAQ